MIDWDFLVTGWEESDGCPVFPCPNKKNPFFLHQQKITYFLHRQKTTFILRYTWFIIKKWASLQLGVMVLQYAINEMKLLKSSLVKYALPMFLILLPTDSCLILSVGLIIWIGI